MNERIRELAVEAGFQYIKDEGIGWAGNHNASLPKFAELIVRKFDDILLLEYLDCVGNKDKQAIERVQLLRARVKIYFGVEE